ncbi:hypothetical protein DXG01_014795 [Tephrocybe rancida]|nr:hypothetical protein DXG01_014795 [Tephrocybe rancida]
MVDLSPVYSVLLHSQGDDLFILFLSLSILLAVFHAFQRHSHIVSLSAGKSTDPPMIASWLPWVGNGLEYMFRPLTFFKTYSNQNNSLFKFKVFGQTFVAISSPTAVSNLFRDRSGSFDTLNGQNIHLLTGIKTSEDRVPHIYSVLRQKGVPPVHRAMMPSRLPIISSRLTEELLKSLKKINVTSRRFSLNDFVHRTLYNSASIALLGTDFPIHTFENFMIFDEGAALQVRQLGAFAKAANAARESVLACWTRYFVEHWVPENGGHLAGAVNMISEIYRGLQQADLSHEEVHRLMFGIVWSIHGNVTELTTWVMCHIITDKEIYTRVCQEIRSFLHQHFPQIDSITQMDPRLIDDAFPFLNSVVQEVMRTKAALGPIRVANRDTVIMDDDKEILIRKGEMVAINLPGMHHSPGLQEEPEVFKADRFMESGATYRSYVFGGGKHICAGRNYANFAVRQFIILTLAMYDVRVQSDSGTGPESLPEQDGTMGLKLMLFSRRRNDLSIMFQSAAGSSSLAK